jgi:type II secretory ATPase GspE/PulE/Tfp pilus assembly ATPase PilB-like protein
MRQNKQIPVTDELTLCVEASGLDRAVVAELSGFAREKKLSLIEAIVQHRDVDERAFTEKLAGLMGLPCLTQKAGKIPDDVLIKVSPSLAIRYHIIPLEENHGTLKIACWNPFDWQRWDELCHFLAVPLEMTLCPHSVIYRMLKANYGLGADTVDRLLSLRSEKESGGSISHLLTTNLSDEEAANEPTVVNFVNKILTEAIRVNATDIHFEPYEGKFRVRYRVDGMLEDVSVPASIKLLSHAIVSRVKIMSHLDITEKRLPQDGRSQVSLAGQEYDLRISVLPGIYGEAIVIRLQSRQMVRLDLDSLGFTDVDKDRIKQLIIRPYGLILVTGPTGSGKTTTLYTCLSKINNPDTKIITIEDPVEYWMDDILQMQVHEEIGFTFARALRGILRHDPDVLLIGEIRDRETADIAVRSSLTGHLVFATLHTNDAAGALPRIMDIGIEPFLLASSINGIIAQRLVRTICTQCKIEDSYDVLNEYEQQMLKDMHVAGSVKLWKGRGCEKCRFTGYRGRTAIGEILTVSPRIKQLIQQRQPAEVIKTQAYQEGMRTLRESALIAVRNGLTTMAEVTRVTQDEY